VADVELHDLADGRDGLHVVIVEAVAGVDHESKLAASLAPAWSRSSSVASGAAESAYAPACNSTAVAPVWAAASIWGASGSIEQSHADALSMSTAVLL